MEFLGILEKKFASLLEYVGRLKSENDTLAKNIEQKSAECTELRELVQSMKDELIVLQAERVKLVEENSKQADEVAALKKGIEIFESSVLETKTSLDDFHQEKALTKMLVDDLISSIDSLVEQEQ